MKVEIWSDVVCPWCYIGKRRFERALAGFAHRDGVSVVHRSFQLDPAASSAASEPMPQHLARKYGTSVDQAAAMMGRVEGLAAEIGLEYHLARTLSGNTLDAHRVLHLARERGRQDAVLEHFYRAYFTAGQSLFDAPALIRLGAEAGLDAAEVQRVLESDAYEDAVRADIDAAVALGVQGVPFFVVDGRYGISGAQPEALFSRALTEAWDTGPGGDAPAAPAAPAATGAEREGARR